MTFSGLPLPASLHFLFWAIPSQQVNDRAHFDTWLGKGSLSNSEENALKNGSEENCSQGKGQLALKGSSVATTVVCFKDICAS